MRRLWIFLLCTACGPAVDAGPLGEGSTTSGVATSEGTTSVDAASDGGSAAGVSSAPGTTAWATTSDDAPLESSSSEGSAGADGASFLDDPTNGTCGALPDGVLAHCSECSPFEQDCVQGDACRAWANDGGDVWNALRCVPLDDDPGQAGAPCSAEGSGVSGFDSCDAGLMCWDVDAATLEGECVAYCDQNPALGTCADPDETCSVHNEGTLPLCLPACNPIEPSCEDGFGCYPGSADNFVCLREGARVELGSLFHPECPAGTLWASDEQVVGCTDDEPCCTSFCDLSEPLFCGADRVCVPFFGAANPDYPNLGYCSPETP